MKNKKLLFLASTMLLGCATMVSCKKEEKPSSTQTPATSDTSASGDATSASGDASSAGVALAKGQLKVWGSQEDINDFFPEAVEAFKAKYPAYKDLKFVFERCAEGDSATALINDPTVSADVLHYAGDGIGKLVSAGVLYNIPTQFMEATGLTEEIEPALIDTGRVTTTDKGGNVITGQYGIPFTPNTYFMYYDASVFTKDDITSLNKMLAVDVKSKGFDYTFGFDMGNSWYIQSLFYSNGCTMFGADSLDPTKGLEPADKALQAATWVYDFYQGPNKAKFLAGDPGALIGSTVAAGVTGAWNAGTIKAHIEERGGKYAAAPLPKISFDGTNEVAWKSVGDYKHIGVNSITQEPEAACTFAAFLASKDMQVLRYQKRNTAPTNTEAINSDEVKSNLAVLAQNEQLSYTFKQPSLYDQQGYWDAATALAGDLKTCAKTEIGDFLEKFNNTITQIKE